MAASITRGHTYAAGVTVQASNLFNLLVSASILGVDRTNMDGKTDITFVMSEDTDDQAGTPSSEPWFHTVSQWPLTVISGVRKSPNPWGRLAVNNGPDTVSAGRIVAYNSTVDLVTPTDTIPIIEATFASGTDVTDEERIVGITAEEITAAGTGIVITHGLCVARFESSTITRGRSFTLSLTQKGLARVFDQNAGHGVQRMGLILEKKSGSDGWVKLM